MKERQAELEAEKQRINAENEQRLQLADSRYEKRMNDIRQKAKAEGEKVEEVLFLKDAGTENKKALIDCKLTETSERRKAFLDHTKQKQIDILGQRREMAEKRRIAMQEEQKAKMQQNQHKREDAELRRKELMDQRKLTAESEMQRAVMASERKKQLYDEVMDLYQFLCIKDNLWEYLETGLQHGTEDEIDSSLTPFQKVKKRLLDDAIKLVYHI